MKISRLRSALILLAPIVLIIGVIRAIAATAAVPQSAPATQPKAADDLTPTLVNLHYKTASPVEVFDDLFGQMGLKYWKPKDIANWPKISIDAENQPYWEVIEKLQDALNADFDVYWHDLVIIERSNPGELNLQSGPRCLSEPCLLIARTVQHNANFQDSNRPDVFNVTVLLLVEPHLHVARYLTDISPDVAIDERGNSLVDDPPRTPATRIAESDTWNEFQIALKNSPDVGYKIAELKGVAHFGLIERSTTIEMPAEDFAQKKTELIDLSGSTLVLQTSKSDDSYHVNMTFSRNQLSTEAWAHLNEMLDAVEISLTDAKEQRYSKTTWNDFKQADSRVISRDYVGSFGIAGEARIGPAATLKVIIPDSIKDVAVPYEFKNLPLP